MGKFIDLTGQRFGKLLVISHPIKKYNRIYWLCHCDCGKEKEIRSTHLTCSKIISCGCNIIEKNISRATHRMGKTRIYKIWSGIKDRCNRPKNPAYKNYGGRGIKICRYWEMFENFYEDMFPTYQDNLEIERIDNNKGYSKENCQWASRLEQANNKRNNHLITYQGKTQGIRKWERELNISHGTLWSRLMKYHWSVEEAFTKPII